MSSNDSLTIIGVVTGIVGTVTGVISLVFYVLRDRARLKVELVEATHSNDGGLGLLSVQFRIDNVGNNPTSITSLDTWILDGTRRLTGDLELLRDQHIQSSILKPYRRNSPPPLETFLPQHMDGHSSEIYHANFRFIEGEIQSGDSIRYGLTIRHTHGTERPTGLSNPSPIQRMVGTHNPS